MDQKLQFTYPWDSIKDVQVTEEAFSSQKRTSSTSKHEISKFFLLLRVIYALLDPDPDSEYGSADLIESRSNSDPDPKHLYPGSAINCKKSFLKIVPLGVAGRLDAVKLHHGVEEARLAEDDNPHHLPGGRAHLKTSCCGSMTFWYRSGSADPCL